MKKNLSGMLKSIATVAIAMTLIMNCHAQGSAAAASDVTVSVSNISYEDPALSLLKESLKNNKRVKAIKNSFDQGKATMTLSCSGSATELWDEVPKTTKDFFTISSIDDKHIALQYKNSGTQSTNSNSPTSVSNKVDDDCKNCYFNLCKYDGVKTFQGVVFKQINYDEGTYYYNCDNGVLLRKVIYKNGYGQTTNITTDTVLLGNAAVGTKWNVHSTESSVFGFETKSFSDYTMYKRGVTIQANGATYNDVIVIYYRQYSKDNLTGESSSSYYYYYAKGVGLIKTDNLGPVNDPTYKAPGINADKDATNLEVLAKTMKGSIDQTIVGTWKFHDQTMNWDIYYVFNPDGTYQYYVGSIKPANQMPAGKCYWKVNGKYLECVAEGWDKVYEYELQKKNDAATGKPTLVIQFKGTEYRTYFSEDNKAAWK